MLKIDEEFVNIVIKPWLLRKEMYLDTIMYMYAHRKKELVENYIKTVLEKNEDVICLTDSTHAPCITKRKGNLINYEIGEFTLSSIYVVVKVIESWILAGVDNKTCKRLSVPYLSRTDHVHKNEFYEVISKSKFKPRVSCRIEMLKNYDIILAAD